MDWQVLTALVICGVALVAYVLMGDGNRSTSQPVDDLEDTPPPWRDTAAIQPRLLQKADDEIIARFLDALRNQP